MPSPAVYASAFLGAAEATLAEWTVHGRATRDQAQMIIQRTLLAMVTQVLPRLTGASAD